MKKSGFTVIEVLVVAAFLITAGVVLLLQVQKIHTEDINSQKKTAINAIYHSLEEGFHPAHGHYPEYIEDDTLPTMDATLLTDPNGHRIGTGESSYRYEPKDCQDGQCESYTLRATLENEDDFVKSSQVE